MSGLPPGVIWAVRLDGAGGATELDADDLAAWEPADGLLWVHLQREQVEASFGARCGLKILAWEALTAEETRPRSLRVDDGLVVLLRAVNLLPGADPDELVTLRLWLDANLALTAERRPVHAVPELRERLARGLGPRDAGGFLEALTDAIAEQLDPVVDELEELVDDLEETMVDRPATGLRKTLSELRRQAISLRRYLAPQREVLVRLQVETVSWLAELERAHLREVADHLMRLVEDLDMMRDHAAVIHDELTNRLSEELNRRMYVLSVLAAVFVPLTFASGLMGMNVGGVPAAGLSNGFALVCLVMAAAALVQVLLFRRMRWL